MREAQSSSQVLSPGSNKRVCNFKSEGFTFPHYLKLFENIAGLGVTDRCRKKQFATFRRYRLFIETAEELQFIRVTGDHSLQANALIVFKNRIAG